jgi:acyl-coenzyme A thioesterase PaaI-like protein
MNKTLTKLIDKLITNSTNKAALTVIEKMFNNGIPFNLPHKFKFMELTDKRVQVKLPFIKKNKNHLGGIHACATATLGEYAAGLSLIKSFGSSSHRLIMEEIHVNYIKQAKEDLIGEVIIDPNEVIRITNELITDSSSKMDIVTNVMNKNQEIIAVVQTKWQLKSWKKVSFK